MWDYPSLLLHLSMSHAGLFIILGRFLYIWLLFPHTSTSCYGIRSVKINVIVKWFIVIDIAVIDNDDDDDCDCRC